MISRNIGFAVCVVCVGFMAGCGGETGGADRATESSALAHGAPIWTGWFSEENGPMTCPAGTMVDGVACSGDYCDNIRLRCSKSDDVLDNYRWMNSISEEAGRNQVDCASDEVITGMQCDGSYCDNVRVRCSKTTSYSTSCTWVGPFSEEQAAYVAGTSQVIAGLFCSGRYCDNFWYKVCYKSGAEPTCKNRCGAQSLEGTCWCDAACTQYGDCCYDYVGTCK